jgi:hypothetical protein
MAPPLRFAKRSLLGDYLRVYGRSDAFIFVGASERPQREPLYVRLVEAGRLVHRESFQDQATQADRTWGQRRRVELAPVVHKYQESFRAMRANEVAAAMNPLGG